MLRLAGAHPPPHARISALRPRFGSSVGSSHPETPGTSRPRPSSKLLTATRASAHPARKQPPGRGDRHRSLQLQRHTRGASRMSVSPPRLQVRIALRASGRASANAQTAAHSQAGACRQWLGSREGRPRAAMNRLREGPPLRVRAGRAEADFGLEIVIARVGQSANRGCCVAKRAICRKRSAHRRRPLSRRQTATGTTLDTPAEGKASLGPPGGAHLLFANLETRDVPGPRQRRLTRPRPCFLAIARAEPPTRT